MEREKEFRSYDFSDEVLVAMGKRKIEFMRRDSATLESFGISVNMINELESVIHSFDDSGSSANPSVLVGAIDAKEVTADRLRLAIKSVMIRVELKYDLNSDNYNKFGAAALSQQSDSELLHTAKRVVFVGTEFLKDLLRTGITLEMINSIATLCDEFEVLVAHLGEKIAALDVVQQSRVKVGNSIFNRLLNYSSLGLNIWEEIDPKYNDYIICELIDCEVEEEFQLF